MNAAVREGALFSLTKPATDPNRLGQGPPVIDDRHPADCACLACRFPTSDEAPRRFVAVNARLNGQEVRIELDADQLAGILQERTTASHA